MKHMRKCAAFLLALVMAVSMAITVSAEGTGSITVKGTTAGKTYDVYKIFDLTMAGQNSNAVAYTLDTDWEAFFAAGGAGEDYITDTWKEGLNPIAIGDTTRYINITKENVDVFAQAALAYAVTKTPDATETAEGETVEFTGLDLGYYLVYPQGATDIKDQYASICSLTSTVPSAEVELKATYPTIEKKDDAVSADLGKTVNYTITGKVPDTTGYSFYEYTLEDTMSEGLTFHKNVKATIGGVEAEGVLDYETIPNGFRLTFDLSQLEGRAGQEIQVTYSAAINEKAVVADRVEKNKAVLIYSNDPNDRESKDRTPIEEEEVYSSQIVIDKVDGATSLKLAEAEFVLMNAEGLYYCLDEDTGKVTWVEAEEDATVAATDENGAAGFLGLANGTYELKEIKAPDGYNLLTETVTIVIDGENAEGKSVSVTKTVENRSGTELPSTGGMGTALFYTFGGILVTGAVVMLIARKRVRNI